MGFSFKRLFFSAIAYVYPPLCLHCQTRLKGHGPLFCSACLENLPFIDFHLRCRTCFLEVDKGCQRCRSRKRGIHSQSATLECLGPAKTLFYHVAQADAKAAAAAAALMVYHFLQREQKIPDCIIPLPLHWLKKQGVDRDPHLLLATHVAELLEVPVLPALKNQAFRLRTKYTDGIADKRLLLVAPLFDDSLFRQVAMALQVGYPARVEALALVESS